MSNKIDQHLHAVIIAGGSGQRFWPKSRKNFPKPLIELGKNQSLLKVTFDRALAFVPRSRIWIVCGKSHAKSIGQITKISKDRLLIEPQSRNTAMAIGFSAERIFAEDSDAVLAVLPADHHISSLKKFTAAIRYAARAAFSEKMLITLGVIPRLPSSSYGYIQMSGVANKKLSKLQKVKRFIEKPNESAAYRYYKEGGYFWNAGIFVWSAKTILSEIQKCAPSVYRSLAPIRDCPKGRGFRKAIQASYEKAPNIPIDIAVLEKSQKVWVLPATFKWSDVGTWSSLAEELGVSDMKNCLIEGDAIFEQSKGNLVWGSERTIVLLNVEGLAVIDTGDALLVAKLEKSSEVRQVVKKLKSCGYDDLL